MNNFFFVFGVKNLQVFKQKFGEVQGVQGPNSLGQFTPTYNVHLVTCYGLFEYLTLGIEKAGRIFEDGLEKFDDHTLDHEQLLTAYPITKQSLLILTFVDT